jgi:hypothetical protein
MCDAHGMPAIFSYIQTAISSPFRDRCHIHTNLIRHEISRQLPTFNKRDLRLTDRWQTICMPLAGKADGWSEIDCYQFLPKVCLLINRIR